MISIDPRKLDLLRAWLFLPGAELEAMHMAAASGADVLVQELEDFTPPDRRPQARALSMRVFEAWRQAGATVAVRINPLAEGGEADLRAVMQARPEIVMMSKVAHPRDMVALDALVTALEREHSLPHGQTLLVPNIESALGVVNAIPIAQASQRIRAMLVATEDTVADLGADRTREGTELLYPRARFLLECTAAGVTAIDCPYTFKDAEGAERDMRLSCAMGYKAKAVVHTPHVAITNTCLTPQQEAVQLARRYVSAFENARAQGKERAEVEGMLVEVPSYFSAKRLLSRSDALANRGLTMRAAHRLNQEEVNHA